MQVDTDILIVEITRLLAKEKEVRFCPSGNSMRPFIEGDRDSVLIAPLSREPERGDIILARAHKNGQATYVLHRLIRIESSDAQTRTYILQGDGNLQGEESCARSEIIGRVVGIETPKGHRKILTRGSLWRLLFPCRPLLLKIYRHTWLKWCY